jgi:DnaJ-domain-containing protein 1
VTAAILAWSLATPLAVMIAGGTQPDAVDGAPASAIEYALSERACMAVPSAAIADADARQRCMDAQLSLLRTDFGRDLQRLTAAERRRLDARCSPFGTTHGREAYLDCVNSHLVALRVDRRRATATRAQAAGMPMEPAVAAASARAPEPELQRSVATAQQHAPAWFETRPRVLVTLVLASIAAIAAGSFVVLRRGVSRRHCHQCGIEIVDSGDLCAPCRHAAADAVRRAASGRIDPLRTDDAERRNSSMEAEERRQQLLRDEARQRDEEERVREQHEAQRHAENARRLQEQEARRQIAVAAANASSAQRSAGRCDGEFDPYAVLGVPRDTPPDQIRAAYEKARTKYDQSAVAHLGVDVQEHFRQKAQAVDRAYQMLAG